MWFLIAFVSAGIDIQKYKLDTVCYVDDTSTSCGIYAQLYEKDFWEAVSPGTWNQIKDNIGKFVYAGPGNARKALGETKNYLVQVLIAGPMGDSAFDVSELDDHTVLYIDALVAFAKGLNQTESLVQAQEFLKKLNGVAHLREMAAKQRNMNRELLMEAFLPTGKGKNANTLPVVKDHDSQAESMAKPLGIRSVTLTGASAYEKIDYLMIENCDLILDSYFHVPAIYFGELAGLASRQNLQADYVLLWAGTHTTDVQRQNYQQLGVLVSTLSQIDFFENSFRLRTSSYGVHEYSSFNGSVSVLVVSKKDLTVTLQALTYSGTVPNLNLSLQSSVMTNFSYESGPAVTMTIQFAGDWDDRVSTAPELILETDNTSTIDVLHAPRNVRIQRTSADSRVRGGGRSDVNIGLIIGIIVAVVAVIIIIVVIVVVCVVCCKKKAKVEGDNQDATRSAQPSQAGSQPQAPYGQQYPYQYPQQYPYQYPQQYPSSQYPQQYPQYQQPPPQYQQPPPQYQQPAPQQQQPAPQKQQAPRK